MMTADALERAWAAWDAKPGDASTAAALEKACQAHAKTLGLDSTQIRERLSEERRAGTSRADAIEALRP